MKFIPNAVIAKTAPMLLKAQKSSPTALFAVGVVGVVATAITASRATLKLDEMLTSVRADLDLVESAAETGRIENPGKLRAQIITKAAFDITKLYAPTFVVGAVTIAALTGSHQILTKRNAALTAAYKGLDKAFKEYRTRVSDEIGEEREKEVFRGVEERTFTDAEGKEVTKKLAGGKSPYHAWFDDKNKNWSPIPEYNTIFLTNVQNWANDILRIRGHVFLNEVYDRLGLPRTKSGAVTGWVSGHGDGYVDFDIENPYGTDFYGFIELDFNVDGVILDLI